MKNFKAKSNFFKAINSFLVVLVWYVVKILMQTFNDVSDNQKQQVVSKLTNEFWIRGTRTNRISYFKLNYFQQGTYQTQRSSSPFEFHPRQAPSLLQAYFFVLDPKLSHFLKKYIITEVINAVGVFTTNIIWIEVITSSMFRQFAVNS